MATGSISDGFFEKNPKQFSYTLETALQIRRRSMTQPQIPHGYDAAPENAGELWRLPGLSGVPGVRSSRTGQDVAEPKRCNPASACFSSMLRFSSGFQRCPACGPKSGMDLGGMPTSHGRMWRPRPATVVLGTDLGHVRPSNWR